MKKVFLSTFLVVMSVGINAANRLPPFPGHFFAAIGSVAALKEYLLSCKKKMQNDEFAALISVDINDDMMTLLHCAFTSGIRDCLNVVLDFIQCSNVLDVALTAKSGRDELNLLERFLLRAQLDPMVVLIQQICVKNNIEIPHLTES